MLASRSSASPCLALLVVAMIAGGCSAASASDDDAPGTGDGALVSDFPEIPYHAFEPHRRLYAVWGETAFVRSPDDASGFPSRTPGIYVAPASAPPRLVVERRGVDQGSLQVVDGALYFTQEEPEGATSELWRVRATSNAASAGAEKVLTLPVRGRALVVSEREVYVVGSDALVRVLAPSGEEPSVERVASSSGSPHDLVLASGRLWFRLVSRPNVVSVYDPTTKQTSTVELRDDVRSLAASGGAILALGPSRAWRIDPTTREVTRVDAILDAMDDASLARCDEGSDGRELHEGTATTPAFLVRVCASFEGAHAIYAFPLAGGAPVKLADVRGRTVSSVRASPGRAFWFEENPRGWSFESAALPRP